MQIDLDRTQEWLNRTQAIRRKPAVRGGMARDTRTPRETGLFVMLAMLIMLLLIAIPRPTKEEPKRIVSAAQLPTLTNISSHVATPVLNPQPYRPLVPSQWRSRGSTQVLNEARIWRYPPRSDRIAPHAPIWIVSEPVSWTPPVASTPSVAQQLPPTGISVLNR